MIKHVLFNPRNILFNNEDREIDDKIFSEFCLFAKFLKNNSISVSGYTNSDYGNIEDRLKKKTGIDFGWLQTKNKRKSSVIKSFLKNKNLEDNEVLYIGNSKEDMIAARNGKLLFLNGIWYKDTCNYGLKFNSFKEIARFLDIFLLRKNTWSMKAEFDKFTYYSLAPFSTYKESFSAYSKSARATLKDYSNKTTVEMDKFWGYYIISSLFLADIHKKAKYICIYPAHKSNNSSLGFHHYMRERLINIVNEFCNMFHLSFIENLIIRHTTSQESKFNRDLTSHKKQLDTICLNRSPNKGLRGSSYKTKTWENKTVLVIDDICTEGYSLDSARILLENVNCTIILCSWLKTINRNYKYIVESVSIKDPYKPFTVKNNIRYNEKLYSDLYSNYKATSELSDNHKAYFNWEWDKI